MEETEENRDRSIKLANDDQQNIFLPFGCIYGR